MSTKLKEGQHWVSCASVVHQVVARYRHIVTKGALTTACGCTASNPDTWEPNMKKPKCPDCLKKVRT